MKIPEGWVKESVAERGNVQAGRQLSPSKLHGNLFPYLRVANVYDGQLSLDDVKEMAFSDGELEIYRLTKNDLLLNEGQSESLVGRCAIYSGEIPNCCFQNTLIRFRPNTGTDPKFAFYSFQRCLYDGVFKGISKRTTSIAHLGVARFGGLKLLWPDKPEQRAIADTLSTWDAAIEKTERLIAAKKRFRKAKISDLVFGSTRLSQTKPVTKVQRQFFAHPEDWEYCRIGDVGAEVSQKPNDSDLALPVLSCSKYDGLVDSLEYFGKKVFSDDTSGYKVIRKEQFAYPSNHIEEGSIGLLNHRDTGLVSPIYIVFRVDTNKVHPPFLFLVLKTDLYKHIFRVNTSSSVDRRGNLRWDEFSRIHVALPPLEEQQAIVALVGSLNSEIDLLRKQLDLLKLQKRGLMQKLLTGTWRVKTHSGAPR